MQCFREQKFRRNDQSGLQAFRLMSNKQIRAIFKYCQIKTHVQTVRESRDARITIAHVCSIALSLAGSLWRCLNTRPSGLVFKQLPRDPANVNA